MTHRLYRNRVVDFEEWQRLIKDEYHLVESTDGY